MKEFPLHSCDTEPLEFLIAQPAKIRRLGVALLLSLTKSLSLALLFSPVLSFLLFLETE